MPQSIIPADLQTIIDTHRRLFGGWTMMADAPADAAAEAKADPAKDAAKAPEAQKADSKPADDQPLGEGGKKALETEREARKALERQMNDLRQGLASLAGGADPKGATPEDAIAELIDQFTSLKDDLEVERLARQHGITDERDITLLRKSSADARSDLAARLKPTGTTNPPGNPKPDPSVGKGGGDTKSNSSTVSAGRELFAERHKKTQTTSS